MNIDPVVSFVLGFILASILAFAALRFRMMDRSGSAGMILIGTVVFGLGGPAFAVPLIFFFLSSSILSLYRPLRKVEAMQAADKIGPRDIRQVFANGGVATAAVILHSIFAAPVWFAVFLAALAEAAADTWGTEIGTLSRSRPISLITFRKINPGQSGGVSIMGTFSSLAGSSLTVLSGLGIIVWRGVPAGLDIGAWIIMIVAGFAGALFDSLLGAALQARFECPVCHRRTESRTHCGRPGILASGFGVIDNDMVNFLGTLFAGFIVLVYMW
jgi:uncharacterized protein (TIGR00297 family)